MKNADMFYWTKLLNLFHNEYIIKNIFNADNADLLANFFVFEIIPTIDFFKREYKLYSATVKDWKYVTKMQLNLV